MFEMNNVRKIYDKNIVLNDITMDIQPGMNFIVGPSGSGKTTLMKILAGFDDEYDGSVFFNSIDLKNLSNNEKMSCYRNVFGFIWQDFHLLEKATVKENISLPYYVNHNERNIDQIMKKLEIDQLQNKKVSTLSLGQKQRVAIARELAKNPQVIFCDEPTSALDENSSKIIMDILRELSKTKTIIVVTHNTLYIEGHDSVFELDKGNLISSPTSKKVQINDVDLASSKFKLSDAVQIVLQNIKNHFGRYIVNVITLLLGLNLLLLGVGGTVNQKNQQVFDDLVKTYGEGILDIGLVGSFVSAAGGNDDQPNANVSQNLNGLYETYLNDERVEFITFMQPFENIQIGIEGKLFSVEKTGNSPVLTKLISGEMPQEKGYQVVVPVEFIKTIGLTPDTALNKEITFTATIFQWIDDQPIEKPVHIEATICGVADNTVVYDYQGKQYSYTIDDSFFFNASALEDIRKQAGVNEISPNLTIRTKTPEDLIALKDELNKKGIVPLGRFELVEDIVRLNQQTSDQSSLANLLFILLSVLIVIVVFGGTMILRKKEISIFKLCGYTQINLNLVLLLEIIAVGMIAFVLCSFFHEINVNYFCYSVILIAIAYGVSALIQGKNDIISHLKSGDKV